MSCSPVKERLEWLVHIIADDDWDAAHHRGSNIALPVASTCDEVEMQEMSS